MKTMPLKKAYQLLENANAVIIKDDIVLYPSLWELRNDETNEFLYLQWENDEGLGYYLKFCEGDNQEVKIVGSSMFLIDTDAQDEDDHTQITLLSPMNLD